MEDAVNFMRGSFERALHGLRRWWARNSPTQRPVPTPPPLPSQVFAEEQQDYEPTQIQEALDQLKTRGLPLDFSKPERLVGFTYVWPGSASNENSCTFHLAPEAGLPPVVLKVPRRFTSNLSTSYRLLTQMRSSCPFLVQGVLLEKHLPMLVSGSETRLTIVLMARGNDNLRVFLLNALQVGNLGAVAAATNRLIRVFRSMHQSGLLHNDYNCSNILVEPDGKGIRITLIDVDNLTTASAPEAGMEMLGTDGFQHPHLLDSVEAKRTAFQGDNAARMDFFSEYVIILSLAGYALDGSLRLFEERKPTETLVFKRDDLHNPTESHVFELLKCIYQGAAKSNPAVSQGLTLAVEQFKRVCEGHISPADLPPIETLVTEDIAASQHQPEHVQERQGPQGSSAKSNGRPRNEARRPRITSADAYLKNLNIRDLLK